MAVDARMSTITSKETHAKIKDLSDKFNLSTSKTINNLVETALQIQPEILWEMAAAKNVLGYDIIEDINKLIGSRRKSFEISG